MVVYLYRINKEISVLAILEEFRVLYHRHPIVLIKKKLSKNILKGSYYVYEICSVKRSLNLKGEITDWDDFLYRHLSSIYMTTSVELLYKYEIKDRKE